MLPPLRISLLGGLSFQLNDTPLTSLTALKAQALLIYLAVTGRSHTRASLAGLLWSDVLESAAHNSLRVTLAQLRQAIGDYVDANRQAIALVREPPIRLDVTEFAQACSRLLSTDASIEDGEYQVLRTGVHLYGGDFAHGFYVPYAELFEEWVAVERAYYARLALDALTRLGAIALQRGSLAQGIEDVQAALSLDPLLEEAHQLLMQLYAHQGQSARALRQYEQCVRVLEEELGIAPAPETVSLFDAIRTRTLAVPERHSSVIEVLPRKVDETTRRPRHNLPHQTTPFVGRTSEIIALHELLATPGQRLVTILAPGGMGKSRLAQEAALAELPNFADGVYFVPLAPLSSVHELVPAIAAAINYPMRGSEQTPQAQLLDFLRRKTLLLILDNFEHLLDGVELVTEILQAAGAVKILVTSRERLNLSSESLFPLGGLELPAEQTPDKVDGAEAVTLFVQHARRVLADFTLTGANRPAVVQICHLTLGMPLGIVLAAAWVALLPVEEIATEIAQSLDFLAADLRDLPERQRSLASIFESTWQRLAPPERDAFMRLATFRNGFSRQAAQIVAGVSSKLLLNLADKALIQSSAPGRYEIHELLRQFGLRMLARAGMVETAYAAHSRYFLHFIQVLEDDLKGRRQLPAMAEIDAELDNLRAAWSWAVANRDYANLGNALEAFHLFFALRGRVYEGGQLLWSAYTSLENQSAEDLRLRVLVRYCLVPAQASAPDIVRGFDEQLAEAIHAAEARGDAIEAATAWFARGRHEELAAHALERPNFDRARHYLEESLTRFDALNDYFYMARIARSIGSCYGYDVATMPQHLAYNAAGLEYARRGHDQVDEVAQLGAMGWGNIDMGQYAEAERYFREARELSIEQAAPHTVAFATCGLAYVYFAQGRMETAAKFAEEGREIAREFNNADRESIGLVTMSLVAAITGDTRRALELCEASLEVGIGRYFRSYADWTLAMIHCALHHPAHAWYHLQASHHSVQVPASIPRMLAVAAVLLGEEGEIERAAEVLGAVMNDLHSAAGWMEQWAPFTELRASLQATLGHTKYQTLLDQGAKLNAEKLADELLGRSAEAGTSA